MHPIRIRNFQVLLGSRFLASLSTGFYSIPLYWWILQETGSGSLIAVAALTESLTFIITAPLGGLLADRLSKKRLSLSMYLLDIVLGLIVGYLILTGEFQFIFVLPFFILSSLADAVRAPALEALGPLTIPSAVYQQGNASMGLARSLAQLSSFGVAGVVTSLYGPGAAVLAGAGGLTVTVLVFTLFDERKLHFKRDEASSAQAQEETEQTGVEVEQDLGGKFLDGLKVLRENPLFLSVTMTAILLNFILAPLTVIIAP